MYMCVCVGCPPPDNGHMDTLKKCFGFSKFKPLVIHTVSHNYNSILLHPCNVCTYMCMHVFQIIIQLKLQLLIITMFLVVIIQSIYMFIITQ